MSTAKPPQRKPSAKKLEPIDWHEFANDAVLNGNMSTLYQRPANEDPSAYASDEALIEIEKRGRPGPSLVAAPIAIEQTPTVGPMPTVGLSPAGPALVAKPTVGILAQQAPGIGTSTVGLPLVSADQVPSPAPKPATESTQSPSAPVAVEIAAAQTKNGPTVGLGPDAESIQARRASGASEAEGTHPKSGPTVGLEAVSGQQDSSQRSLPAPTSPAEEVDSGVPTVGLGVDEAPHAAIPPVRGREGIELPTVGLTGNSSSRSQKLAIPTVGIVKEHNKPTVGIEPTVGVETEEDAADANFELIAKGKIKRLRDVQDALTLAGHVLYKAMYGVPDGAKSKTCAKGYRQLANETHLDKDTVRDLIVDFKGKGMVREVSTYDPDTRSAKTYDVLSYKSILQMWREAGLLYVTTGRQRPNFCTPDGEVLQFKPTVGPVISRRERLEMIKPTVGLEYTPSVGPPVTYGPTVGSDRELLNALAQITGAPIDQEAAGRLFANCRAEAPDCTIAEIVEFAWSKAFLCRSGKIANPIGFLIIQVPKHFQGEALEAYRDKKRKELESAAALAAEQEHFLRQAEQELAQQDARHHARIATAERHRSERGIDLKTLQADPEADQTLKEWARRMQKQGPYQSKFE